MWIRFVFASRYICFFASLHLTGLALHTGSFHDASKAGVFMCAMIAGHQWLKRRGKLAECRRALDELFTPTPATADDAGLESLLQRQAALEQKRGTPGFNPWEVQAVRREISEFLNRHPRVE